jgi:hypothetical protein
LNAVSASAGKAASISSNMRRLRVPRFPNVRVLACCYVANAGNLYATRIAVIILYELSCWRKVGFHAPRPAIAI